MLIQSGGNVKQCHITQHICIWNIKSHFQVQKLYFQYFMVYLYVYACYVIE